MAWVANHGRVEVEMARSEMTRLRQMQGKKADSIWEMPKRELVDAARMELGMTQAQAEKDTVTQ